MRVESSKVETGVSSLRPNVSALIITRIGLWDYKGTSLLIIPTPRIG